MWLKNAEELGFERRMVLPIAVPAKGVEDRAKGAFDRFVIRTLDIIIALAAIVHFLPVYLVIAVLIAVQDGGPVFFVQKRIGRNGKDFHCFKFRSMRVEGDKMLQDYLARNADERLEWETYHKLKNDPRVTPVGRFLRKTSLDEFPQLLNVLIGDMSVVGPRPILRNEIAKYGASYHIYKSMRPGITGLWQVMGRNNLSYLKRIALDRLFARKASIVFYFIILFMTVPVVLFQKGSR